MQKRPLIAIPSQTELDAESFLVRRRYTRFLQNSNADSAALPIIEGESEILDALSHFDGLMLTGGADIDATIYGGQLMEECDEPHPERDALELSLISAAKKLGMPILGICRGLQIINVSYGGTLYQKIPSEVSDINHWQPEPYDAPSHHVHLEKDTLAQNVFGEDAIFVNSMHHQAVKEIGDGLVVAAKDDNGLVESLYDPNEKFLIGIQWHPEYAPDLKESHQIGDAFVEACRKYMQSKAMLSKTNNSALTNEYLMSAETLDSSEKDRMKTWEYLDSSTSKYDGITVYSSFLPKLFDQTTYNCFKHISETIYSVLSKVIQAYIEDSSYRQIFGYDSRSEELILLPTGYEEPIPMMRVDVFFDEDTLETKFCEFNSDGSSGMNENREITIGVEKTDAFDRFAEKHEIEDCITSLFDGWVEEFLRIYETFDNRVERPTIAIVDFLEHAVVEEFKVYGAIFQRMGYEFAVYDMRELRFKDGALYGEKAYFGKDGMKIDAVWRRCISTDVVENWDASQPLIEAVRNKAVALIGGFAGHIIHDKRIFYILDHPETKKLLTDSEIEFLEETIPHTALLNKDNVDLDQIKRDREKWVIKPSDSYGSQGVYVGLDYDDAEWSKLVDEHSVSGNDHPYLVQEFCAPYPSPAIPLYGKKDDYTDPPKVYKNLSGLFVYAGNFAGVFSRQGPKNIILGRKGGVTAPSMWVDVEK